MKMFENENATMTEMVESGAQETVVESPAEFGSADDFAKESRYDDFEIVGDGRESAVGSQEDGQEKRSEVGEDDGGSRKPDGAGQAGTKTQTREENAAIRAARIRAEHEAAAAERAKVDEMIANSGIVNPITKKPFANFDDFLKYGEQFRQAEIEEKAKASGRTVEEVTEEENDRDFIRKLRRASAQDQTEAPAPAQTGNEVEFIRRDVMDFVSKHPDVDLAKLEANESFLKFCGSRFKREPLADLYDDYMTVVGGAKAAAAVRAADRANRSTGGGVSGGGMLSPEQTSALERWNRENPELQMTAKEFLTRG